MNDNELFELCKQVYEKTGWKEPKNLQLYRPMTVHKNDSNQEWEIVHNIWSDDTPFDEYDYIPLYTSDYLLEKLPPKITGFYQYFSLKRLAGAYETPPWTATYGKGMKFYADTPLKALLLLTLALDEAGQL
jgi:hypothetical protein